MSTLSVGVAILLKFLAVLATYLSSFCVIKLIAKDYYRLSQTGHVLAICIAYLFWFFVFIWK